MQISVLVKIVFAWIPQAYQNPATVTKRHKSYTKTWASRKRIRRQFLR